MRLVVPVKLQHNILHELHCDHPGISHTKTLAWGYTYGGQDWTETWSNWQGPASFARLSSKPQQLLLFALGYGLLNPSSVFCWVIHGPHAYGWSWYQLKMARALWDVFHLSCQHSGSTEAVACLLYMTFLSRLCEIIDLNLSWLTLQNIHEDELSETHCTPYHSLLNGAEERFMRAVKVALKAVEKDGRILQHTIKISCCCSKQFHMLPLEFHPVLSFLVPAFVLSWICCNGMLSKFMWETSSSTNTMAKMPSPDTSQLAEQLWFEIHALGLLRFLTLYLNGWDHYLPW